MRKKASSQSRSARLSASPEQPLDGRGMLVVVELGGEWPSQASVPSSPPMTRRVLAQAEGEAPAAFAERVADSLDGLFGRGIQLETIVLACNERVDDAAEAARRKTVSLALGSMAKHKSGRAYLAASSRSGGRLRHALAALAQGLFDEWRTAGLEVSLDFGDESRLTEAAPPQFVFTARVA
jgi:hypothetical protein